MFFLLPLSISLGVYVAAAIVPAIILMKKIYDLDKVEKEPVSLLVNLIIMGVIAALASMVLETIGEAILNFTFPDQSSPVYTIILAFLVVAAVEEGTKYFFLYRKTWNSSDFNYRFDGVVYAAFVSLGFAAFENIGYVFNYGLSVALPRAILSIPGHLGFSIVFGYFYGRAKQAQIHGDDSSSTINILAGYILAVLLHGFYDACAMLESELSALFFIVFIIVMYFVIIRLVKAESASDEPIDGFNSFTGFDV